MEDLPGVSKNFLILLNDKIFYNKEETRIWIINMPVHSLIHPAT